MNNLINPGRDIHAEAAWDIYTGNSNNIIAVVDGGVVRSHLDLNDKIAGGDTGIGSGDWESHGTHVAGIAAAESNNGQGVAGVDWNARIHPQRIDLGGDAETYQAIVDAVNYSSNVYVLNNSYGLLYEDETPGRYSTTVRQAVAYAYKNNRIFVAAMGNHQNTLPDVIGYPAGYNNVIAVGSTNSNDVIAGSSVHGSHIDVCAPGVGVYSTITGNTYGYMGGTSMAAPHVAGLASLLKGYNTNLANDDVENIIRLSADKTPNMTEDFDNIYGYGRINAARALGFLEAPYKLEQLTATGGTVISTSSQYSTLMISAPGLSTGTYLVKRIEVQKTVNLPNTIYNVTGVWGRGVFTTGWNGATPNFGEGFCEVVPGSQTSTNVTLRTHVYQVYNILGQYLGYYPTSPSNVTFAYSVLGLETPSISGPSTICTQGAFTINNPPQQVESIEWIQGPYLAVASGQGTTSCTFDVLSHNGIYSHGSTYVTATITYNSGNSIELRHNLWAGIPDTPNRIFNFISDGKEFGSNQYYWFAVEPVTSFPNPAYEWSVTGGTIAGGQGTSSISVRTNTVTYPQTFRVSVRAGNSCGWSGTFTRTGWVIPGTLPIDAIPPDETLAEIDSSVAGLQELKQGFIPVAYTISIAPNPATGETTLTIESAFEEKTFDETAEWDLEVYSPMQALKTKKTRLKGKSTTIQTSGWAEGVYMVRVKYNGEVLTGKLIVKR
jgi:hypothetical protein